MINLNWIFNPFRKTDPETSQTKTTVKTLTQNRKMICECLYRHNILNASDIAFISGIPRDTVTPALARMANAGLVKKTGRQGFSLFSPNTKTAQNIWTLTSKGITFLLNNEVSK